MGVVARGWVDAGIRRRVRPSEIPDQAWILRAPPRPFFPVDIDSRAWRRRAADNFDAAWILLHAPTVPLAFRPNDTADRVAVRFRRYARTADVPDDINPQLFPPTNAAGITAAIELTTRARRVVRGDEVFGSLLQTTLGGTPPPTPFVSIDDRWQRARRRVAADDPFFVNPLLYGVPIRPVDLSSLPRRKPGASFSEWPNLLLELGPPKPFGPADLTQAARRWLRQVDFQTNALAGGLLGSAPPPRIQSPDLTIAKRRRSRVAPEEPWALELVLYLPPVPTLVGGPRYIVKQPHRRVFEAFWDPTRPFTVARLHARDFTVTSADKMGFKFDIKGVLERVPLTFDFSPDLDTGETLIGTPTIAISTVLGVDGSPSSVLNGSAGFDSTSKKVIVPVKDGLTGCNYQITVTVGTSNPAKVLELVGVLPVRTTFV